MNLALFDFDGTITNKDTFTDFIHFAVDRKRLMIGKIILSPFILGYKLGVIPAGKTREIIAGFGFRGRKSLDVNSIGLKYCNQMIPKYIRPIALKRIKDNYNIEDHQIVYAYGDTAEDKEMLDLADIKFFRWKVLS